MAIVETTRSITGGVDTHLDTHVVAALDPNGGVLGVTAFPATRSGYCLLSSWLGEFGMIGRIGVEGTGAYGAGLARHLRSLGVEVIEVDRPNRQLRRAQGKSDTIDAIEAARAVLSGRGNRRGQDGGRQRGGDAGPAHRQALRAGGPHHMPQPDPPPGLHRTRRAAGTVPASVTGPCSRPRPPRCDHDPSATR